MTTGKTVALTRRTFVGKVMSLLFNMLSRLVSFPLSYKKKMKVWEHEVACPKEAALGHEPRPFVSTPYDPLL